MISAGIKFTTLKEIKQFVKFTDTDLAKKYSEIYKNDIYIIGKERDIYYYNETEKLWMCETREVYVTFVADFLNETGKNLLSKFLTLKRNVDDDDADQLDEMTKLQKEVNLKIKYLASKSAREELINLSTGRLQCNDFETRLNNKHDYFPIKNGLKVDMKKGTTSERTKEDYFSFYCQVGLVNETPHADKFFREVMPNIENREFLRKCLGYCMTGDTSAQCFFVVYGKGANGKSEMCRNLELIMNKFFHTCGDSIFELKQNGGGASPDQMDLMGKRCGTYSEGATSDNMNLNMPLLKRLSGQDSITTRALYKNNVTFRANIKLILATNFVPSIDEDDSCKRRLKYLFFDSSFKSNPDPKKKNEFKIDEDFINKLQTEYLDEVFTWIMKGAQQYYVDKKIEMSPEFARRTDEIFQQEDSISAFVQNRLIITGNVKDRIRKSELMSTYQTYCNDNSLRCKPRSTLHKRLEDLNITHGILDGYQCFKGIKCESKPDEEDDEEEAPKVKPKPKPKAAKSIDNVDSLDDDEVIEYFTPKEKPWFEKLVKEIKPKKINGLTQDEIDALNTDNSTESILEALAVQA